ncbi:phage tail protein [Streptomyces sp. NPDC056405]|uniref:phage tail protein n=1 Tax=Streptomyces sp. NPDC056405 TaxID=3345811 RepID=UPI0035E36C1C
MASVITIEVQAHGAKALDSLKKSLISLAPAAAPVAATLTSVAAQAGAAAVATAAFGAALGPQIKLMSEAAESEATLASNLGSLPPATREAAKSFLQLKNSYKAWSDELADDTMPVVNKSLLTMAAILPGLDGMVEGVATQYDRLITLVAGGVAGGAFTTMTDQLAEASSGALQDFTDNVVHLSRVMSEGSADGPISEFFQYARENGPAVRETLGSIGKAVMNLLNAMAAAGPSALAIVNALAQMVAAIPPEFLGTLLKLYTAFKLVSVAASAFAVLPALFAGTSAALTTLTAASAAAGGGLAGLRAAFMALSVTVRAALITTGVGAIVVALASLSSMGQEAPPDIDKVTSSLKRLGETGKNSGEAARAFGDDFSKLGDSLKKVTDPEGLDQLQQSIISFFGTDSTPIKDAKENIDAFDKGLANLVKSGNAQQAEAALKATIEALEADGTDTGKLRAQLGDYDEALADLAFEQQMAAQSMGVFGQAAQDTQAKLNAQKQSADGLRESLNALNNANLIARGGMRGMEAAIDAANEAVGKNGATLDENTAAGRDNAAALDALATATMKAGESALENGASWEEFDGIVSRGRENLIATAMQMGLNEEEAIALADAILQIPDADVRVAMEKEDAQADLDTFFGALEAQPDAKSIRMDALTAAGEAAIEALGLKVERAPDGSVTITALTGQAISGLGAVQAARDNLSDKTIRVTTIMSTIVQNSAASQADALNRQAQRFGGATGGLFTGRSFKRGYATGGKVTGPGTGTSDDVFAPWLSNGEFVMKKTAVDRYGEKFMQLVNEGRLDMPKFAKGGKVSEAERARRDAVGQIRADTTVSRFGQMAGWRDAEFVSQVAKGGSVKDVVTGLTDMRALTQKGTSGGTERRLLRQLDSAGRGLLRHQKHLDSVNKSLEKAKDKLDDLKDSAAQLRNSVKSGIVGEANITQSAKAGDAQTTINTILGQMTASAANSKQFAKMLADLKKKGLSGDLIEQVAEAGIDGGGMETAAALLGGGSAEIKRINALQKEITKQADAAGKTAADAMYGAGIKAAEGLVKGLQAKQDLIEKMMMQTAKSMEKAIKRALGIKSPSKVMEEVGEYTAEGFALGIERNRRVKPAWASMLNVPVAAGPSRGTFPAGRGAEPVVLEINSGGSRLDDLVVEIIRKSIRTKGGGNVQSYLGA